MDGVLAHVPSGYLRRVDMYRIRIKKKLIRT
jgi:hypothetical protein